MARRGATLVVGLVVVIMLAVASVAGVKVPYVALTPGPTWNTLGTDHNKDVIQISGASGPASKGQLRMVTVGVEDQLTLWDALRGWVSGDDAVVPREVIYPPDETQQQIDQQNQEEFKVSQNAAILSALRELGYPVHVVVKDVTPGLPAIDHLEIGDELATVDGQPVTSAQKLTALIRAKPAGSPHTIGYVRHGTPGTTTITGIDKDGGPRIGIQIDERQPSPYKITISLDNVGGPSAGLMFTLGIIDKIKTEDLTGGLAIAGTGTIDEEGSVGPIGGIPQKMRGAKRDGATVFLSPANNCAEAVANAVPGLKLVKVETLGGALQALATLRSGGSPALCTAK
jgi:PDZ domain-containing protein